MSNLKVSMTKMSATGAERHFDVLSRTGADWVVVASLVLPPGMAHKELTAIAAELLRAGPASRPTSLAVTKLEEALHWMNHE